MKKNTLSFFTGATAWLLFGLMASLLAACQPTPINDLGNLKTEVAATVYAGQTAQAAHSPTPSLTPPNPEQIVQTTTAMPPAALPAETQSPQINTTATPAFLRAGTPLPTNVQVIAPENAANLTRLAVWGDGQARDMAISADGRWMAVAGTQGLYIYYADSLEQMLFFDIPEGLNAVAFSPDGTWLAAALTRSPDPFSPVALYRVSDWAFDSWAATRDGCTATQVAFSADGLGLTAVCADYQIPDIVSWAKTGERFEQGERTSVRGDATLLLSPDGRWVFKFPRIYAGPDSDRPPAEVWRVGEDEAHFAVGLALQAAFSLDSRWLVTASIDPQSLLTVWDVESQQVLARLDAATARAGGGLRPEDGDFASISALAFSPDGTQLTTAANEMLWLWDWQGGELHTFPITPWLNKVVYFADGMRLLVQFEGQLFVLDVRTQGLAALGGFALPVGPLVFDSLQSMLYTVSGQTYVGLSGDLAARQLDDGIPAWSRALPSGSRAFFSPGGESLLIWSPETLDALVWWKLPSGAALQTLHMETSEPIQYQTEIDPLQAAFSTDGRWLAAGSNRGDLWIWSLPDGSLAQYVPPGDGDRYDRATALAITPDGAVLAVGGGDGLVRLYSQGSEEPVILAGQSGSITALAFSPDGALLASGDGGGNLWLWDVAAGAARQRLIHRANQDDYPGSVIQALFSPDGRLLLTQSNSRAWVWETASGQRLSVLDVGLSYIPALALSPDGSWLALGLRDGGVELWGVP